MHCTPFKVMVQTEGYVRHLHDAFLLVRFHRMEIRGHLLDFNKSKAGKGLRTDEDTVREQVWRSPVKSNWGPRLCALLERFDRILEILIRPILKRGRPGRQRQISHHFDVDQHHRILRCSSEKTS